MELREKIRKTIIGRGNKKTCNKKKQCNLRLIKKLRKSNKTKKRVLSK